MMLLLFSLLLLAISIWFFHFSLHKSETLDGLILSAATGVIFLVFAAMAFLGIS